MTTPRSSYLTSPLFDSGETVWLRKQLARFTYKPGWTFSIEPTNPALSYIRHYLTIVVDVEDTYRPGHMIKIGGQYPIFRDVHLTDETAERMFALTLATHIESAEIHESREWLRRDGEIYNDPHKPRTV